MSNVQFVRDFITERLTAAATEIFGVFEQTIVQYEEEINRQRKLLDIFMKPEIKLHRTDCPHQDECNTDEALSAHPLSNNNNRNSSLNQAETKLPQVENKQQEQCTNTEGEQLVMKQETHKVENVLIDQEPYNKDSDSCLDQEEPEPPQIKEEQQELFIGHEGEELVLKQEETDPTVVTNIYDETEPELNSDLVLSHISPPQRQSVNKKTQKSFLYQTISRPDKRFSCEICGKGFSHFSSLNAHYIIHSNLRPFSCNVCGNCFKRRADLKVHTRIHTGFRPFPCSICGKAFRRRTHLNGHMKVHAHQKNFSCTTCSKSFSQVSHLNEHMRIHKNEKPYSCKICEKDFRRSGDLNVHTKIHTGEKPYSCTLCGKSFRRKWCLNVHMKSH